MFFPSASVQYLSKMSLTSFSSYRRYERVKKGRHMSTFFASILDCTGRFLEVRKLGLISY